jgi:uncharacterized repeat protein (TIGR03803 family)
MPQRIRGPFLLASAIAIAACSSRSASIVPNPGAAAVANARTNAPSFAVLYTFTGKTDGDDPYGALLLYRQNLYGTTYEGGGRNDVGTVFKVDTHGTETVLHRFGSKAPFGYRAGPLAGVIRDPAGNLYGTTYEGGAMRLGTVFELGTTGKFNLLHSFSGADGAYPRAGVIRDSAGNLYGTTEGGGSGCPSSNGCGTVFKLDATNHESVLHSFTYGADGAQPYGGLVRDPQGNLYGTTISGGLFNYCPSGCGIVFKVNRTGRETVLYRFAGGADGEIPFDGLIRDAAGNLYGTTGAGGTGGQYGGTVFKLDRAGRETVLYNFTGGKDGVGPFGGVIQDAAGNFYGTTELGGGTPCEFGCGTVFKVDSSGRETVLYRFTDGKDGASPVTSLVLDGGNLYGTASQGGKRNCHQPLGCGVVFKVMIRP